MYDIIVLGGGHAGVEAALAGARLGNKTLMILGNLSREMCIRDSMSFAYCFKIIVKKKRKKESSLKQKQARQKVKQLLTSRKIYDII